MPSKNFCILILFFCYIFITPSSLAQEWILYKSSIPEDISIYYRSVPSQPRMIEFKGTTKIKSKLSSLAAVIRDVDAMHEWVYQVKSAEVDELVSDTERYTYIVHNSPFWGFDERDSIVHSYVLQDVNTLKVIFRGEAAPNKRERDSRYERIVSGISIWKFVPLANNWVQVTFQGFANPGGVIEKVAYSFLVKKFLWKLPFESLKNLKYQVKKQKYQNVKYAFIKDAKP